MEDGNTVQSYCVWCKGKHPMKNPTLIKSRHGKMTLTGSCVLCGKKMFAVEEKLDARHSPCLDWQAEGLRQPTSTATAYYFAARKHTP